MSSRLRDVLQENLGTTYNIRQELGGGGMSVTFVAEEVALGRSVVLKVLSPELASVVSAERFEREIHVAARLQHAFIVPLLSSGVSEGQPWYTMPLVQGESLRARIAREGALTFTATARVLRDVAEALASAHGQGVVHRDIKPDNILLSGAHALVTDFGVAKAISASTTGAGVTATGLAIGTPAYMAPEQASGDPATDHRADLYALGAMAYEMLTGRQLFGQRSAAQMLMAHAAEEPEPLANVAPAVPRELSALVHQLLAKHPNDRPARAQDVADALGVMITRWTSGELPPARGSITIAQALVLWAVAFVSAASAAWLGVRWLPIPEWTAPAVAILFLAGLPAVLLSAWLHRPAKPIAAVPSVSSTSMVGRLEAVARPHFTWQRTKRNGAIALGIVTLLAATWAGSRALGIGPAASLRAQGVVAARDLVFVADFDSPPSDTGLGLVVSDLLRTEISRSASIRLVSQNVRAGTLTAMARSTSARIASAEAREFSQRANAKVFLRGSVTQLGTGYIMRASLVETSSGNELASFSESASSADDVMRAVDRMGREVRDKLGASLREVRSDPPLFWAITPSLEAARLYAEGSRLGGLGDQVGALRLFEHAVAIDTLFAEAYRRMASYYGNTGNPDRSAWAAERAFRHREKLPPVVQKLVEGTYYHSPAGYDIPNSIASYQSAMEIVGRPFGLALNNMAYLYQVQREHEKALDAYRENLKLDTTGTFAPLSILAVMWALGQTDAARAHLDENLTRWLPGHPAVVAARARLENAMRRPDSAERIIQIALRDSLTMRPIQRAGLLVLLTASRRAQGRLRSPHFGLLNEQPIAPEIDTASGVPLSVLLRAEVAALDQERQTEARHILDSVTSARPPGNAGALGYRWLRIAAGYAMTGDAAKARRYLASYEERATNSMKAYDRQELELGRGWVAVAEKRYADAIDAFRAADVGLCTVCALAPLGLAYDLSGQADSAIAVLERYLTTRYWYRGEQDQRYLAGTYKRLGELYDAKGNVAKAREYYSRFVELWKNADPELQPRVTQVRRRLTALSPRG